MQMHMYVHIYAQGNYVYKEKKLCPVLIPSLHAYHCKSQMQQPVCTQMWPRPGEKKDTSVLCLKIAIYTWMCVNVCVCMNELWFYMFCLYLEVEVASVKITTHCGLAQWCCLYMKKKEWKNLTERSFHAGDQLYTVTTSQKMLIISCWHPSH